MSDLAPSPGELPAGTVVGDRYVIRDQIGHGGMGTVYLAEHTVIHRPVAIKILSSEFAASPEALERFVREARAAACIRHDNIVEVFDCGETEQSVYIAMEYLEGMDLADVLHKEGPLLPVRAVHIARQIARALSATHRKGVLHRDLKPENVYLIEREGEPDHVKVLDFGLAEMRGEGHKRGISSEGVVFGTPEYMAPEQATNQAVDQRADIYALGCILYEMLTGAPPFSGSTPMDVMKKQISEAPVPPGRSCPSPLLPEIEGACLRALQKAPEGRFSSMREFLVALGATPDPGATGGHILLTPPAGLPVVAQLSPMPTHASSASSAGPSPYAVLITAFIGIALGGAVVASWSLTQKSPAATLSPEAPAPDKTLAAAMPVPRPARSRASLTVAFGDVETSTAALQVRTTPPGALVLWNGRQRLGRTPLSIRVPLVLGIARERGTLVLRSPGCDEAMRDIDLDVRKAASEDFALTCRPDARPAPAAPAPAPAARVPKGLRDPFAK